MTLMKEMMIGSGRLLQTAALQLDNLHSLIKGISEASVGPADRIILRVVDVMGRLGDVRTPAVWSAIVRP